MLLLAIGALGIALALWVMPLPPPAIGGACGPGNSAEPAVAAFFDPITIGAGSPPPSGTTEHYEWLAFIGECQSATDARMMFGLIFLLAAVVLALSSVLLGRPRPSSSRERGEGSWPPVSGPPPVSGTAPLPRRAAPELPPA
jgi:hypothetical protein